jgi:small subunit ribosomal protein S16
MPPRFAVANLGRIIPWMVPLRCGTCVGCEFPAALPFSAEIAKMPRSPRAMRARCRACRLSGAFRMVKIRLSRGGAKGRPFYHVVVTDQRNKRDGRSIENVGYYNPAAAGKDTRLELNVSRVQEWVSKGAQLSDKVAALLKEAGKQQAA